MARHISAATSTRGTRVVYVALGGNLAIAVAKFVAYTLSGSSAILTECIHSFIDCLDQILLIVGQRRAQRRPDHSHPLGYGMETYFWSFIVAVLVLLAGGAVSLYAGAQRLMKPEQTTSAIASLLVLGIAAVFEGSSFAFAFREYKRIVRGRNVRLWTFIKRSKDPALYATLLEDLSALIGIGIAALGVVATSVLHVPWADGAAAMLIGLLLVSMAIVLANETRSLIAGEAVAPATMGRLRRVLADDERIETVHEIATLHLGPHVILVALTISFAPEMKVLDLRDTIREITDALKAIEDRVTYVYVRPPAEDA